MAHGQEIVFFAPPQYRGLAQSHEPKSVFRKVLDTITLGGTNKVEHYGERQFGHRRVASFLEGIRENAEVGVTAFSLGALDGMGHIEPAGIPVDLAVATVGFATKVIAGADSGIGKTASDMGLAGNAVYWARQGRKLFASKGASGHHGDFDPDNGSANVEDDPVVQAATAAGL